MTAHASTPGPKWPANGEPDPHCHYSDPERHTPALGTLTDDEIATGVFLNGDSKLDINRVVAKDPDYHAPIVWLTAAKERIRWLSRALAKATAAPAPASPAALTDDPIIALADRGEHLTPSPTKYPELGHGTQYSCGAPGLVGFARALLAAQPADDARKPDRVEHHAERNGGTNPVYYTTDAAEDARASLRVVDWAKDDSVYRAAWWDGFNASRQQGALSEREAFEAWYRADGQWKGYRENQWRELFAGLDLSDLAAGMHLSEVRRSWKVWQARASSPRGNAPTTVDDLWPSPLTDEALQAGVDASLRAMEGEFLTCEHGTFKDGAGECASCYIKPTQGN